MNDNRKLLINLSCLILILLVITTVGFAYAAISGTFHIEGTAQLSDNASVNVSTFGITNQQVGEAKAVLTWTYVAERPLLG